MKTEKDSSLEEVLDEHVFQAFVVKSALRNFAKIEKFLENLPETRLIYRRQSTRYLTICKSEEPAKNEP